MICNDIRVILWDEAKLDPGNYDNIKRLLAGDQCKVAVKFKEDQIVNKTPIFVCSNNSIFPKNGEFYNTVLTYRWYAFPLWKKTECNLKYHPVALCLMMCWAAHVNDFNFDNVKKMCVDAKLFIRNLEY